MNMPLQLLSTNTWLANFTR